MQTPLSLASGENTGAPPAGRLLPAAWPPQCFCPRPWAPATSSCADVLQLRGRRGSHPADRCDPLRRSHVHLDTCSGVAEPGPAEQHLPAVPRLQAVGDVLLHLLATPQEPAAVAGQLLPGAPPVLSTDEHLVHVLTETHLRGEHRWSNPAAAAPNAWRDRFLTG